MTSVSAVTDARIGHVLRQAQKSQGGGSYDRSKIHYVPGDFQNLIGSSLFHNQPAPKFHENSLTFLSYSANKQMAVKTISTPTCCGGKN